MTKLIDVGGKPDTLRSARATGCLRAPAELIDRVREGRVEKGDCLAVARVAGVLAAKRTDALIPLCHPLPIHASEVEFELHDTHIDIGAEVAVIGPTGVEMEALAAVSAAALTLYDMLKMYCPADALRIDAISLVGKRGGKSHFKRRLRRALPASVIVLSDTVAAGDKQDTAGQAVRKQLAQTGFEPIQYTVLPDEPELLRARVEADLAAGNALVAAVGGTGLGPRDTTVETLAPLITTPVPGIMEAARAYGQRRTPYAMLSRGIAGLAGRSLIMTLPGSRGGASESMEAVLPGLVHLFDVMHAAPHADDRN